MASLSRYLVTLLACVRDKVIGLSSSVKKKKKITRFRDVGLNEWY